jgi:peptidoglycan/LPS O-acetylase OafA/YrhL
MAMKRFIRTLVIATLVIIIISAIVYAALPSEYYTVSFPFLIVFFFAATMLVYYFMLKSLEKRPAKFVNIFLLTTMAKLFVYMAVMVSYALVNRDEARQFIIAFFILYIIYTIIEVLALLGENSKMGRKKFLQDIE